MKKRNMILLAGAALAAAKGLDNRLEVTTYKITSHKLPQDFDDFKIVQVADFHCDKTAGIIDAIRNEKPDIICAVGDMTHDIGSYDPFINILRSMLEIAPVYIVSGNHDVWRSDYAELVKECRKMGAVYLRDERVYITKNDTQITLTGIEDPFSATYKIINENIQKSISKFPESEGYNILMFHRANLLDRFEGKGYDLILSGHMHGGQIRIPGIGGIICPKTNLLDKTKIIFPKYFGGEYDLGETKAIVSRGIGNPAFIPRVFNRPEICSVILKSE